MSETFEVENELVVLVIENMFQKIYTNYNLSRIFERKEKDCSL